MQAGQLESALLGSVWNTLFGNFSARGLKASLPGPQFFGLG